MLALGRDLVQNGVQTWSTLFVFRQFVLKNLKFSAHEHTHARGYKVRLIGLDLSAVRIRWRDNWICAIAIEACSVMIRGNKTQAQRSPPIRSGRVLLSKLNVLRKLTALRRIVGSLGRG